MEAKTGKAGLGLTVGGFICWPSGWDSFIGGPGELGRMSGEQSSRDIVNRDREVSPWQSPKVILIFSQPSPHLHRAGVLQRSQKRALPVPPRSRAGPFLCAPGRGGEVLRQVGGPRDEAWGSESICP